MVTKRRLWRFKPQLLGLSLHRVLEGRVQVRLLVARGCLRLSKSCTRRVKPSKVQAEAVGVAARGRPRHRLARRRLGRKWIG